jgi:hypothetical protein
MKYIIGLFLFLIAATSWAANSPLPELTLADKDGVAVNLLTLKQPAPWVMLIVDANKPQTQLNLTRLQKKDGDWGSNLVVIAIGNQAAFTSLLAKNDKLLGVRWYRDTSGNILKTLSLPGVPAALGITPDNQINWHAIGLPDQVEKAQSLVGSWIGMPAIVPVVK